MEYSPELLNTVVQSAAYIGMGIGVGIATIPFGKYALLPFMSYLVGEGVTTKILNKELRIKTMKERTTIAIMKKANIPTK